MLKECIGVEWRPLVVNNIGLPLMGICHWCVRMEDGRVGRIMAVLANDTLSIQTDCGEPTFNIAFRQPNGPIVFLEGVEAVALQNSADTGEVTPTKSWL